MQPGPVAPEKAAGSPPAQPQNRFWEQLDVLRAAVEAPALRDVLAQWTLSLYALGFIRASVDPAPATHETGVQSEAGEK